MPQEGESNCSFSTIVRPKLEYASASWDPHYEKEIAILRRVQRKAARFCLDASVSDMLKELEWDTSELRREKKNRLAVMYKLNENLMDTETEKYLLPNSQTRTRKRHPFKYRIPRISMDFFKFSFCLDPYGNGSICLLRLQILGRNKVLKSS